ncbi:MAG: alpha/beta hydrolase [Elusimicrobiota bacterium]
MKKALVLAAGAALLSAACTRYFFYPDAHVYQKPERVGLAFDTPTFPSLDGTRITGIFFHSKISPTLGTVVHFHGNGGNITSQWGFSAWLAGAGFNVFIPDYRGFGASQGSPNESGAVKDAVAALRYVRRRPDVNPDKILVFGQSLGGAVAVAALALSPRGVRALALESPFDSYRAIARDKLSQFWLTRLIDWPLAFFLVSDRYEPLKMIRRLPPIPIVVIHGTADKTVPYQEGLALYNAAKPPKEMWTVAGGGHVEAFTLFGSEYRPRLIHFFEAALAAKNSGRSATGK